RWRVLTRAGHIRREARQWGISLAHDHPPEATRVLVRDHRRFRIVHESPKRINSRPFERTGRTFHTRKTVAIQTTEERPLTIALDFGLYFVTQSYFPRSQRRFSDEVQRRDV